LKRAVRFFTIGTCFFAATILNEMLDVIRYGVERRYSSYLDCCCVLVDLVDTILRHAVLSGLWASIFASVLGPLHCQDSPKSLMPQASNHTLFARPASRLTISREKCRGSFACLLTARFCRSIHIFFVCCTAKQPQLRKQT
jgi:hypothetical protein